MADNVAVTAGSGTTIAADEVVDGTLGTVKVQYVKLMDATLDGTTKAAVGANGLSVDVKAIVTHPVTVVSGGIASGAVASGAFASGALASGSVASGAFASGSIASGAMVDVGAIADAAVTAGATGSISAKLRSISRDIVANIVLAAGSALIGKVDVQFAGTVPDTGVGTGGSKTQRVAMDTSQLSPPGQAAMASSAPVAIANNQNWPLGMSPRSFSVAFATLTRPANTTAYTAGDSISDNATAGSVTALVSGNISDTNDDPITITDILVSSTDTGLAGKKIRAYLFSSNPTSSSGVGGGDNAAYSQKVAGYIGSFQGWMETGFSDGTVGRLVPTFNETNYTQAGGFVVAKPVSGARTLYIQYQAVEAFTPSANSTTIIGTARGFQGRAS